MPFGLCVWLVRRSCIRNNLANLSYVNGVQIFPAAVFDRQLLSWCRNIGHTHRFACHLLASRLTYVEFTRCPDRFETAAARSAVMRNSKGDGRGQSPQFW